MNIIKQVYYFLIKILLKPLLNAEERKPPFPKPNERAMEYAFTLKHIRYYATGKILDIGSGRSSWPHLLTICGYNVRAIDKMDGYWEVFFNRHIKVYKDDITDLKTRDNYQFITCISTLEHIDNYNTAMVAISRILEPNGYLVLTFPYNEKKYGLKAGQPFTQVFSRREIDQWVKFNPLRIIEQIDFDNSHTCILMQKTR